MSIWLPHIFGRFQPLLLGSFWAFLIALLVKNPPAMQETQVQFLGQEDPLEKRQATHSSILGLPCGSAGKEYAHNVRDLGLIPGLGRSPGEGNSYTLQYSGLENSMDCIVGSQTVRTRLSDFHFDFQVDFWAQNRESKEEERLSSLPAKIGARH